MPGPNHDLLSVTELLSDPDFVQSLVIIRSSGGSFQAGGWVDKTSNIDALGVVVVATSQDLRFLPEGDRVSGAMKFYCRETLFETRNTKSKQGLSDILLWRGSHYKISKILPYFDYGFCAAIGVRMEG